jgi:hypothetical protein
MDNDVSLSSQFATMTVLGTLDAEANTTLTISAGTVTGTGMMTIDNLVLQAFAAFDFEGTVMANALTSSVAHFDAMADFMIEETLTLASGTLSLGLGSSLDVGSDATIVISGGSLTLNGGTIGLSGNYNVLYTSGSATAGIELSGSGLQDVTVDVGSLNAVTLTADLTISGTLSLTNGTLVLDGNDLTLLATADVSSSGSGNILAALGTSNITVNSSNGLTGSLTFNAGSAVNNFTVNVGAGYDVRIGGDLAINGALNLTSGNLDFGGASLTLSGSVTGAGALSGNSSANLTVTTAGGLPGGIEFASGGQVVNNFTVSVGGGNSVGLNSDLTITGTLDLSGGSSLDISGVTLTIASAGDVVGSGSLVVDMNTNLVINANGDLTADLALVGGILGDFTVDVGNGGSVGLGSDLTVAGTLTLQSGTLELNGHDLVIGGDIAASGIGDIASSLLSDITINTASTPSGALTFSVSGQTVGNLNIDITNSAGYLTLGSDVEITGSLNFVSGSISVGGNTIEIGAAGSITGAGSSAYVIVGSGGSLSIFIAAGSTTEFPVGTVANFSPATVELNLGSASGMVEVGVSGDVFAQGTTGIDLSSSQPVVDATWLISSDIAVGLDMDLELMWSTSMEVNGFNRLAAYISHYTSGMWDVTATANAQLEANGMYSIRREGITSLSPFAVFDENTTTGVSELVALEFNVFPNPATSHITITTSELPSDVLHVEVVNMIGNVMAVYDINGTSTSIPVDRLSQGNYFLRVYNDGKLAVVKKFARM